MDAGKRRREVRKRLSRVGNLNVGRTCRETAFLADDRDSATINCRINIGISVRLFTRQRYKSEPSVT